jgi:hypothetical protein
MNMFNLNLLREEVKRMSSPQRLSGQLQILLEEAKELLAIKTELGRLPNSTWKTGMLDAIDRYFNDARELHSMSQVTQQNGIIDCIKQLQGGGTELREWIHGLDDLNFNHLVACVKADPRYLPGGYDEIPI